MLTSSCPWWPQAEAKLSAFEYLDSNCATIKLIFRSPLPQPTNNRSKDSNRRTHARSRPLRAPCSAYRSQGHARTAHRRLSTGWHWAARECAPASWLTGDPSRMSACAAAHTRAQIPPVHHATRSTHTCADTASAPCYSQYSHVRRYYLTRTIYRTERPNFNLSQNQATRRRAAAACAWHWPGWARPGMTSCALSAASVPQGHQRLTGRRRAPRVPAYSSEPHAAHRQPMLPA